MSARALLVLVVVGCDDDVRRTAMASAPNQRSEMVQASSAPNGAGTARLPGSPPARASAPSRTTADVAGDTRKLCEPAVGKSSRDLPNTVLPRKAATGARVLPATITGSHWTWVNLWAAWCQPCKDELPRIVSLTARLTQAGRPVDLALVSLDDDERQLERFLADQPDAATRASYWLREGREREEWLRAAGLPKDPALPVQLLVDARGRVRCVVNGEVDMRDYAELAKLMATP